MNLALLSNKKSKDLWPKTVSCDPGLVEKAHFTNLQVRMIQDAASLAGARFVGCKFKHCYFGNFKLDLQGVVFEKCEIADTTFMYGQLEGAIFVNTKIKNCALRKANLKNTVFKGGVLHRTDLDGADLHGAQFDDVELTSMDFWGWHGYEGATIADDQKYKFFETKDLPAILASDDAPVGAEQVQRIREFLSDLGSWHDREIVLRHQDYAEILDFDEFIRLGRYATTQPDDTLIPPAAPRPPEWR